MSEIDEGHVMRVANAITPHLQWAARYRLQDLDMCESPIERIFGAALLLSLELAWRGGCVLCSPADESRLAEKHELLVMPQYPWKNYRIDFVIRMPNFGKQFVFIECDGHDFHERTPDQAARDRAKDREIQAEGIPILRFTGREIYRDLGRCVDQVYNFLARD